MARSLGLGPWDLFRPLDLLASLWSTAAAVPPVSTGAVLAYQTLFTTVKRLLLGRRLTVMLDSGEMKLTITELDARLEPRRLAVGQLSDVTLSATDINWDGRVFECATLTLHNVHLRPGVPPTLVAAPVDITLEVRTTSLNEFIGAALPRLAAHVDDEGVARLRWAGRPWVGSVEVDTVLDGRTLWLTPRVLHLGRRRFGLPNRTPSYPIQLPALASGLILTDVKLGPNAVHLSGQLPQWQADLPRARIEDLLNQLSAVGPLTLSLLGWG
jgi:hypothetical protein